MPGEKDLQKLLEGLSPEMGSDEYVFITLEGNYGSYAELDPVASFLEAEGLSLVIAKSTAVENGFSFEESFKCITLKVHSSLSAVGLTAAVSTALSAEGISANVIAAFHHDHVFVPSSVASKAMKVLLGLGS